MYTEEEAQKIVGRVRGTLRHPGQTIVLRAMCPRCSGAVKVKLVAGPLGTDKDIADVHCDACAEHRQIEWP